MTSQSDIHTLFSPFGGVTIDNDRSNSVCKDCSNRLVWLVRKQTGVLACLLISFFTFQLATSLPAAEVNEQRSNDSKSQVVFSALFRSIDSFLNYVDQTLIADTKARVYFCAERLAQTELYTADGSDFSRPVGLIVKTDGESLLPYYFFPVKDHVRRLNNIILLPQIYLPIKDEYGPTNRYQVRQDIPVLGGFHIFYWPLDPLLAQEQNGWIWVTTAKGFEALPKEPLDLLPGFQWKEGELFRLKFNAESLSQPLGDGLLELARAVVCDAPRAMWSEKKVGPNGAQWGKTCYQYALRVLHGTQAIDLSCVTRKERMTFTLDWRVDPQSDWAKFFNLQVERPEKYPALGTLYPRENVSKAFKDILIPDEEQRVIQTILAASKVSRTPEWFWSPSVAISTICNGRKKGLITEDLKFTPQNVSLKADIAGAFFAQQISSSLRSENEEKKKDLEEKKKRKKIDQFDIVF